MTKKEHIEYWLKGANRDWETVNVLFNAGQYHFSLFVCHLSLEKLLKALWVKDNAENTPPFSHNLEYIANQTQYNFSNDEIDFFRVVNAWNIEARYEDFKDNFYKRSTKEYTKTQIEKIENIRECLLKELQKNR